MRRKTAEHVGVVALPVRRLHVELTNRGNFREAVRAFGEREAS